MRSKLSLSLLLIFGIITVVLIRNYIRNAVQICTYNLISDPMVCVAKKNIVKGTKITTEHIHFKKMPLSNKPLNAYFWKERAQLLGLIVKTRIKQDKLLIADMFKEKPKKHIPKIKNQTKKEEQILGLGLKK